MEMLILIFCSQVNGINTQGENIADNGGLKEAYRAYQSWVSRKGRKEPVKYPTLLCPRLRELLCKWSTHFCNQQKLPGLKYTPEQLFWISAATAECGKYRPESLKFKILTDVHSPAEFRVRGPFSNMKEFADDFSCPAGSYMNPEEKCHVW